MEYGVGGAHVLIARYTPDSHIMEPIPEMKAALPWVCNFKFMVVETALIFNSRRNLPSVQRQIVSGMCGQVPSTTNTNWFPSLDSETVNPKPRPANLGLRAPDAPTLNPN